MVKIASSQRAAEIKEETAEEAKTPESKTGAEATEADQFYAKIDERLNNSKDA